ncbi:hypothetical protein [Sphingomonas panni]|uniref:hypothetical protein n=1 Tax=Sphingomonas panni TaxID=237612 RepID=UPI001F5B3DED|nr:hypothetical protein [Sphingomonas panni]
MDAYTGSRAPFNGSPGVASTPAGNQAFTVDADNAVLANWELSNYKTILRQKSEDSYTSKSNVTMRSVRGTNVNRVWETVEGQETFGAVMQDVHYTQVERAVARWFSVHDGLIENVTGSGLGATGEPFGQGITLDGQCRRVTIRDCDMSDFGGVQADGSSYSQGEGFGDEGNNYDITYGPRLTSRRNGDAGYDIKSNPTFTGVLVSIDNPRDWRLWNGVKAETATLDASGTSKQVLWFNGLAGSITALPVAVIGKLIARNPAASATSISRYENGRADVTILDYDIHKGWRGKLLHFNAGSGYGAPTYSGGGRVEQDDGSWITYPGSPPVDAQGRLL